MSEISPVSKFPGLSTLISFEVTVIFKTFMQNCG